LAALRAGLRHLVLDPTCPAFARIAALASAAGGIVLGVRPAALDLGRVDLRRAGGQALLAQWLCNAPDDTRAPTG
jgi:hypothetical protein